MVDEIMSPLFLVKADLFTSIVTCALKLQSAIIGAYEHVSKERNKTKKSTIENDFKRLWSFNLFILFKNIPLTNFMFP